MLVMPGVRVVMGRKGRRPHQCIRHLTNAINCDSVSLDLRVLAILLFGTSTYVKANWFLLCFLYCGRVLKIASS